MIGWREQFAPPTGRNSGQVARFPVPAGGVNSHVPLSGMPPDFMPYAYNIYSSEQGLYTRQGYREWATGHASGVRTLVKYDDPADTADRLFSVTPDGIFDITSSTASPTSKVSFPSSSGDAGWGVWETYRNDAGDLRILLADGQNGLYVYNPGTDTWALETGITGLTEGNVRFVTNHKLRLWFVVEDSPVAYYMPVGAYTGAATEFNFAAQFPNGGNLVGMWNWTIDGGEGVDDFLVAMASSGDVVAYQGDDPSSAATWSVVGRWNIGELPVGRRLAAQIGGELHLLSRYGVISVNDLLRGVNVTRLTGQNSIARNVVLPIRLDMATREDNQGWGFFSNLSDGFLIITRPIISASDTPLQYVFNMATNAWGFFRGPPMQCGVELDGIFYFGDRDGVVHYFTGSLDGVSRTGTGGDPVDFSFSTSYQDMGSPGVYKIGLYSRPTFISTAGLPPAYRTCILYDYDLSEVSSAGITSSSDTDVWDTALWDSAVWGGEGEVGSDTVGASGMGRVLAIALRGSAQERSRLVDLEIMWRAGGWL